MLKYQCKICSKKCKHKRSLIKHLKHHVPTTYPYFSCKHCNKQFIIKKYLRIHSRYWHSLAVFKCDYCQKEFKLKQHIRKHILSVHERENRFQCVECFRYFPQYVKLMLHLEQFHDHKSMKRYECMKCGNKYYHQRSLETHIRDIHSEDGLIHCDICNIKLSFRRLYYHKNTFHSLVKREKIICNLCGNEFCHKQSLQSHLYSVHGLGPKVQCEICLKNFKSQRYLQRHMKLHHTRLEYKCSDCGKKYKIKNSLKLHQEKLHLSSDKNYICDLCNHMFKNKDMLITHIDRAHKIECEICGKMLSEIRCLQKHMRAFHGAKPKKTKPKKLQLSSEEKTSPRSLDKKIPIVLLSRLNDTNSKNLYRDKHSKVKNIETVILNKNIMVKTERLDGDDIQTDENIEFVFGNSCLLNVDFERFANENIEKISRHIKAEIIPDEHAKIVNNNNSLLDEDFEHFANENMASVNIFDNLFYKTENDDNYIYE